MAEEIEMKLALGEVSDAELERTLHALVIRRNDGAGLVNQRLVNRYYDNEGLALNNARVALRIRAKEGRFIQTLKTKGESVDGVHRRGEWEWELPDSNLNSSFLIGCDAWPADISVQTLGLVFETNFTRAVSKFSWEGSEIEIAYDDGLIIACGKQVPIREIELELVTGDPSSLLSAYDWLAKRLPVTPDDVSKAERGYQLFSRGVN